jgi:RNA polymerase sigma-70 factor (ECF subfamily)
LSALQRLLWAGPEPAGVRMPEESLPAGEADTLWRALRRLSATDQQVIYLRYFLELSVAETAEAMETAPGTVKSRLNRALNRLREVIEREFPGLWKERIA